MDIAVICENSGALSSAFRKAGHNVTSCDFEASASPGLHYKGNCLDILPGSFDLVVGFPPCQFLAKAQMFRYHKEPQRVIERDKAVEFVKELYHRCPRIALENPVGYLNTHWKNPTQIVYPWMFGDPYRKEICWWLKDVPPLLATLINPIRKSISNHTNSRMNQAERSKIRSSWSYYPLMCEAIANQWS